MGYGAHVSPVSAFRQNTYPSSLSSSASTSVSSTWSDASSQASDDTSISAPSSDSEQCDVRFRPQLKSASVSAELRQNPRRTACAARAACPPSLVRQSDRKVNFVDSLVDSSAQIVEAIWPLSSVACRSELGSKAVLPLRTFIQETLRRSRTSYSTLQVALYYLILIKPHVPKHDFTMEQPDERQSGRALQCGRRMFLAALILASKYLQDRNYSARAWSKISGLPTFEINQNEIAFLLAVNWKLHIADEVFQRWTEIVLNYTPPPAPPSPDGTTVITQQAIEWKRIILKLNVELTNIDGLAPRPQLRSRTSDLSLASPRSILNNPLDARSDDSADDTPTPRTYGTPAKLAPITTSVVPSLTRPAPTLGLLPTPRLTPQSNGFCTPAAGAASQSLTKSNAMGLAMAQANTASVTQYMDRMPTSVTSSPQCYFTARRSSLANMSTTSSPESMMSDTSRSSRSSSICSVSSLASATMSSKLSLPSRFRATKSCSERLSMRPTVPSVPEDYVEPCLTSSPEYYSGPVGRDDMVHDAVSDAARALQELHASASATPTPRAGSKRSCPSSWENPLQENVRDLLNTRTTSKPTWPNTLVRTRGIVSESLLQIPMRSDLSTGRKRMCCASEAANGFDAATVHPAIGIRGPGMWEGILN